MSQELQAPLRELAGRAAAVLAAAPHLEPEVPRRIPIPLPRLLIYVPWKLYKR